MLEDMVRNQIEARGVRNIRVLHAMRTVPRQLFMPESERSAAFGDYPLPIGYGQTISQPYIVAVMTELLDTMPGDKVLDVGCAKGFLVNDLVEALPGLEVYGLDISEYAMMNCHPNVVGRLHLGSADKLPFPDGSFDCVICLDTVHNLPRDRAKVALQEIQRLSGGKAFVRVDSYHTPEQKAIFESWVLTAEFHDYPDGWLKLFEEAGYTGDYYWTIIT